VCKLNGDISIFQTVNKGQNFEAKFSSTECQKNKKKMGENETKASFLFSVLAC